MKAFSVYLHNRRIDTVFFDASMTKQDVKQSLVSRGEYQEGIIVRNYNPKSIVARFK
jgi:uncharacterized protein (DUF927 family)